MQLINKKTLLGMIPLSEKAHSIINEFWKLLILLVFVRCIIWRYHEKYHARKSRFLPHSSAESLTIAEGHPNCSAASQRHIVVSHLTTKGKQHVPSINQQSRTHPEQCRGYRNHAGSH